jgi:hypothetical protein
MVGKTTHGLVTTFYTHLHPTPSRSTGTPALPKVCKARLTSWAVGGP